MAGHSKWANIKHRKASQDKKRGKLYTKLIREITVAARMGGGVIEDNPRLRLGVDKALIANMPKDTIERAIARGAGGVDGANVEDLVYEGYAPGGVAVMVEAMTDNRNRTVAEIRHAFAKNGGTLGTDGSVAYLFTKRGLFSFADVEHEDCILEVALEAGADDVELDDDGSLTLVTTPEAFASIGDALRAAGLKPDAHEVTMVPATYQHCDGELAERVTKLIDALEELDDVQSVYSNADLALDLG